MTEDQLFVVWDMNFAFSEKKKDFKGRMSYRI